MIKYLSVITLVIGISGCASHVHPQLKGLDTKDYVVSVIGNVQAAAIQLNSSSQLSNIVTHDVVQYCNTSLKAIRESSKGWQEVVIELTNDLLTNPEMRRFRVELVTIQAIVQELK